MENSSLISGPFDAELVFAVFTEQRTEQRNALLLSNNSKEHDRKRDDPQSVPLDQILNAKLRLIVISPPTWTAIAFPK
jgi:hypothetical protein